METSRRDVLEAAFDEAEGGGDDKGTDVKVDVTPPETKDEGLENKQLQGKEKELDAKGGEKDDKQPDPSQALDKEKKGGDEYKRAAKAADTSENLKPPVSWKPTVKEQWKTLPADVKSEVLRREREMSQFISQNDHHRRFNEQFSAVVRPFQHLIQAQNSTPLQAVRNLMTTAAGLATGNKTQKAQIVAEIIQNYGVDVESLDLILSGKGDSIRQNSGGDYDAKMMQMLQPVYGFMNEVRQAREFHERRHQEEADRIVAEFDAPYYDDVKEDMADIMEMAARRGIEMTIQQAYEKAVALNPEVSEVIAREKAAEEARVAGTRLAKARRVASTIVGGPAGAPDGKGRPATRREQLEAAWDDATTH